MTKLILIAASVAILSFIFLRRYLAVEKNISLSGIFFKTKSWSKHVPDTESHDLTAEEMIPQPEDVDEKKRVKADILVRKSDAYLAKGDARQAEKLLIQTLALDPSAVEAYKRLGVLYLHQQQFTKAENIYRKLIFTFHDEPTFLSNLGMALYSQGNLEEAKKFYKKAVELDSERVGRIFSLGQIHYELKELEDALDYIQKAVNIDPGNVDYLLTLAQLYVDVEMINEARQLAEDIVRSHPDNEDIRKVLEDLF